MESSKFNWKDPFLLDSQLNKDERMIRDTAYRYAQEELLPGVVQAFRNEHTDPEIFRQMGELGLLAATLSPEYGGSGLGAVAYAPL